METATSNRFPKVPLETDFSVPLALALLQFLLLALWPFAAAALPEVVARVGDEKILFSELDRASGGKLSALQREIVASKRRVLRRVISEKILDLAAQDAGLSREDFSEREIAAKVEPVSAGEVDNYYQQHRRDFTGAPASDKAAARFYLERKAREKQKKALLLRLAQQFGVKRSSVSEEKLASSSDDFVLATVGAREIRNAMVEEAGKLKLYRLRAEQARVALRRLNELIGVKILSLAAKSRRITLVRLREDLKKRAARVSDADIDRYYREEMLVKDPAAEKRAERIRPYLEFREAKKVEEDLIEQMKATVVVEVFIREPKPVRLQVPRRAWVPHKGSREATVILTAFANYHCRYCRDMLKIYDRLEKEFQPRVRLALRHFIPLYDPLAEEMARGGVCAAKKDAFWRWHEYLLEAGARAGGAQVAARELGLPEEAFSRCVSLPETGGIVFSDTADGKSIGLNEPPVLLINGRVFGGRQGIERLRAAINKELALSQ